MASSNAVDVKITALPKMVSEREAVLRERAAFVVGLTSACWRDPGTEKSALSVAAAEAARVYPLPKISRPRVVHTRSQDGQKELHVCRNEWRPRANSTSPSVRAGRYGAVYHYHRDDPPSRHPRIPQSDWPAAHAGIAADILRIADALVEQMDGGAR